MLYTQVEENQTYADRDVQEVLPGAEFPEILFERQAPQVAKVQKWGGYFAVDRETRRRNRLDDMDRKITQLSNTIIRKQNAIAVSKMKAAVKSAQTFAGNDWSAATSDYHPSYQPISDIAMLEAIAENAELGVIFDTLILNPSDAVSLKTRLTFGTTPAAAVLADFGINEVFSTPRLASGTGYAVGSWSGWRRWA